MAKDQQNGENVEQDENNGMDLRSPPTWREKMASNQKRLDVSDIFEPNVGQTAGVWIWEIENFYVCLRVHF